ncbi:glycosyltransferase [Rahnella sp. CG8]|nr:glycosyltransferase [Rahnella aceris]MCM2447744.1 glycosyltransferase [Rahnella sp. CG8]UNK53152.1 glycosyltransferase [Rahnella aceris]
MNQYNLLFVGRFDRQKGIDTLLEALKTLDDKKLDFSIKLTMIGSTINSDSKMVFPNFKNIVVEYTGWISKEAIGEYYRSSDCLIVSSRWEGFAMVPLEAMSFNLPIITSDIQAFNEINKVSKLFFNCGNSSSLASIISCINTYDLDGMSERLMKRMTEHYTRERMNNMTIKLYSDYLQG